MVLQSKDPSIIFDKEFAEQEGLFETYAHQGDVVNGNHHSDIAISEDLPRQCADVERPPIDSDWNDIGGRLVSLTVLIREWAI